MVQDTVPAAPFRITGFRFAFELMKGCCWEEHVSAYAAKLDPSNTRARVRGARGHLLSGDPDAAVVLFEQAVALDPALQVRT
jgi:hypothetical protein